MKEWWVDLCPPRFLTCFSTCNPSQQSMRQYLQPAQSSTLRQLHHGYIHLDLQFTRHGSNLTHPQHNHLDAGRYCKIHCITLQPLFPWKQNYSLLSSACPPVCHLLWITGKIGTSPIHIPFGQSLTLSTSK